MPPLTRAEARGTTPLFARFGIEPNIGAQGTAELRARCLVRLMREVGKECRIRSGIPWSRRLRAWSLGFRAVYAEVYGVDRESAPWFVPDFAYAHRCFRLCGFWSPIVGNKLVVSNALAASGIPHPEVLGVVTSGRLVGLGERSAASQSHLLERWTDGGRPAVFRPHWSGGGEGVFFVARHDDAWTVNGHAATAGEVRSLVGTLDRYIVTAFVDQAEYARRIFPRTANTIRVLTLIDEDGPFVASAVHRFGTSRSFPIDNFHQGRGGICASVSTETGILGTALSFGPRHERFELTAHPETGSRIEGTRVPGLERALEGVLAAARCFPEATCVGWDLLITDGGFSVLEANAPPGIVVSQLHRPLLRTPRVARYFATHGFRIPEGA